MKKILHNVFNDIQTAIYCHFVKKKSLNITFVIIICNNINIEINRKNIANIYKI